MQGLQMLSRSMARRGERKFLEAREKKQMKLREDAASILSTGTPEEVSDFVTKNPGAKQIIDERLGYQKDALVDAAKRSLINGEDASTVLLDHADATIKKGGDARGLMQAAQDEMRSPGTSENDFLKILALYDKSSFDNLMKIRTENSEQLDVAGIKEFEYLTDGLGPEELATAKRIKLGLSPRATESAVNKREKAFATESGKLQAKYALEPSVAGAVVAAKNEAAAIVKEAGVAKSNQTAWNVYNESMSNLSRAMKGTETGPFVGFIPAITKNQQIAEGAVAVMAPVLKQMFRASGEGAFTDKDQELLMKMVPTRKDLPTARVAKIKAIDGVVRAKLGIPDQSQETPNPSEKEANQEITREEYDKLPSGATYQYGGKTYRKR